MIPLSCGCVNFEDACPNFQTFTLDRERAGLGHKFSIYNMPKPAICGSGLFSLRREGRDYVAERGPPVSPAVCESSEQQELVGTSWMYQCKRWL